ncbi:MAG: PAS domain S-box protein, partial [Boseongicola sp.]|nr:PAS domain S-box protein [Boseongicola sp.]
MPSDSPELPATDEKARNKKIRELQVLHTEPEAAFNNLVQLAANSCAAPMAAFGLLDKEDYWHKARHHWPLENTSHAETPCAKVADRGQSIIADDAAAHPDISPLSCVQSNTLGAYAGVPIVMDGIGVGCLAVADESAREFSDAQTQSLKLLAEQIALQLAQRGRLAELEAENSELLIQELGAELAEEKYRSIFEHVQEGIFQTTAEGRFISANPMLATIYGYQTPEELTASMNDISGELYVDPERRAQFIQRMQESDTIQNFQSQVRRHDGNLIWISENVRAVRNNDGELLYYEGTVVDITEQKETELALRDSELLYHSLVESIPQNIVRKDLNGQFTFANQKFCSTMDLSLEEIIGKTDHDLSPKALADKYRRDDQYIIETGKSFATTEEHSSPDGSKIIIDVVKTPLLGSDGNITGIQVMF